MIILGNSLDKLKELEDNSVDSVVTDPPYGLSFMGKHWDYDVPQVELWKEVYRVLKPGGYLLSFAGTRTQHRMAVNIEDAGFEIRDMIAWVYGSGFPKSHNIGKAVDKLQGNERVDLGYRIEPESGRSMGTEPSAGKLKDESDERYGKDLRTRQEAKRLTKGNSPYEGWGTALKPALEPITVARKPFKGTVAQNVLKWGTGGMNIDGSRIPTEDKTGREVYQTQSWKNTSKAGVGSVNDDWKMGRFPANLIHDGSDEVVGLFPETKSGSLKAGHKQGAGMFGRFGGDKITGNYGNDYGSAARFFYCAKASKSERNKGLEGFEEKEALFNGTGLKNNGDGTERPIGRFANTHPTVKPVKLMQYLVKLVTPKGGVCLDPFNGSGTTGIACKLEGFDYIGIELDPEYVKLSEARIEAWGSEPKQTGLLDGKDS